MNIVYRSSYEIRFMKWCDLNTNVLEWGSEEVVVPYKSPIDSQMHRYFVDFYIKIRTKSGKIQKYIVEVKPSRFTKEPTIPKRKTQRFVAEVKQWGINLAKWKAATKFADANDMQFMLITEKDLDIIS